MTPQSRGSRADDLPFEPPDAAPAPTPEVPWESTTISARPPSPDEDRNGVAAHGVLEWKNDFLPTNGSRTRRSAPASFQNFFLSVGGKRALFHPSFILR